MSSERRKLSKSELREDEFVEWIMQAVEYVKERAQLFVGGAVAVIVVIVAINYFIESEEANRLKAAALLGDVLMVEQGGEPTEAVRLAEELVSSYAGTPAAAQGVVLLANLHYAQCRYAEAREYYQRYLDNYEPLDVLAYAAQSGLGACLEAEGQLLAAAQHYEDLCGPTGRDHPRGHGADGSRPHLWGGRRQRQATGPTQRGQSHVRPVPDCRASPRGTSHVLKGLLMGGTDLKVFAGRSNPPTGRGHLPVAGH